MLEVRIMKVQRPGEGQDLGLGSALGYDWAGRARVGGRCVSVCVTLARARAGEEGGAMLSVESESQGYGQSLDYVAVCPGKCVLPSHRCKGPRAMRRQLKSSTLAATNNESCTPTYIDRIRENVCVCLFTNEQADYQSRRNELSYHRECDQYT